MIFPDWEKRFSKSNCVIDFGKPLIYKLAPLMLSLLGRARDTWKSTKICKNAKQNGKQTNKQRGQVKERITGK